MKSYSNILRDELDTDSWELIQGEIEIELRVRTLDDIENASCVHLMYANVANTLLDYNFK